MFSYLGKSFGYQPVPDVMFLLLKYCSSRWILKIFRCEATSWTSKNHCLNARNNTETIKPERITYLARKLLVSSYRIKMLSVLPQGIANRIQTNWKIMLDTLGLCCSFLYSCISQHQMNRMGLNEIKSEASTQLICLVHNRSFSTTPLLQYNLISLKYIYIQKDLTIFPVSCYLK
jgi:hypothetical protein